MEKVNSSAAEMEKHEKAEAHKKAKKLNDKDGKAAKKNPLLAKQNAKSKQSFQPPAGY